MDHKENKAAGATIIVVVLLLLPLLYLLSIGPALLMAKNGVITSDQLHAAYAPLPWLVEKVPFLDSAIESYLWLWVGDWVPPE